MSGLSPTKTPRTKPDTSIPYGVLIVESKPAESCGSCGVSVTRREFGGAVAVGVALVVVGCDNGPAQADGAAQGSTRKEPPKLPDAPFPAGKKTDYAKAGVYDNFKDKNVWLISDGKSLIAVSGLCTHKGCGVAKSEGDWALACPCHKAKFDKDGVPAAGSKAERPLDRCKISLEKDVVQIDPTKLFKDKSEWKAAGASLAL